MKRVMIDTNALIRYLGIEIDNNRSYISAEARKIINDGLNLGIHVLFLNAISFIEIWSNLPFATEDKDYKKFKNSVRQLYEESNLRVIPLDTDTLMSYANLVQSVDLLEHDKIIYASGLVFECDTLITIDQKIISFNRLNGSKFEIY